MDDIEFIMIGEGILKKDCEEFIKKKIIQCFFIRIYKSK